MNDIRDVDRSRLLVNYMIHPMHIRNGKAIEYIEFLENSGINFEVTAFEGEYLGVNYRLYSDIYTDIVLPPVQMKESVEIVVIKPNGKVYPCHGSLVDSNPIGDVYSGEFDVSKICKHRCRKIDDSSLCPVYDPAVRISQIFTELKKPG